MYNGFYIIFMTNILLTNDDWFDSVWFFPLLKELSKDFCVNCVAPDSEKSWVWKSISREKELSLNKVKIKDFDIFTLDWTPADCVQIGLFNILQKKPKMVVSGINTGNNMWRWRFDIEKSSKRLFNFFNTTKGSICFIGEIIIDK